MLGAVTFRTSGAGGRRTIDWTVNNGLNSVVQSETLTAFGQPVWTALSGDWDNPANWSTGVVPTGFDDGTIATVGVVTATHASGTAETVDSLLIGGNDTVVFTSGSLSLSSDLVNSGTLAFDSAGPGGGTLAVGGTLANSGTLAIGNGGITAGVTVTAAGLVNAGGLVIAGDAGAALLIGGAAGDTGSITLKGAALLSAGGGVTVAGGGVVTVSAGGTADNLTIAGGGSAAILSGGVASAAAGSAGIVVSGGMVSALGTVSGGTGGDGIDLTGAGAVGVGSAGAATALVAGAIGVAALGAGAATVTNYGTIASTGGTAGTAVQFAAASDILVLEGSFRLVGKAVGGGGALDLAGAGGAGTLSGLGTQVTGFVTTTVDSGANWTLSGNNTIANGVTLSDAGTLINAGFLDATAGALIVDPPIIALPVGTLINNGTIAGTVTLAGGGYLDNTATMTAVGNAVYGASGANTAVNSGVISGSGASGIGVLLNGGGLVDNAAGLISGAHYGISLGGGGTVTNAGTVAGASGTAVVFGGTGSNRLVLDPGYVLVGTALGATGAGATNTLELAVGTGAGTLAGLGTEFVHFGSVTVDSLAQWTLAGANTIGAGVTLAVAGALADRGSVVVAASGTLAGALTVEEGGSAEFQGAVGNGATIAFGAGGTLVIDDLASAPLGVQQQDFTAPLAGLIDGDKLRIATAGLGNFTGIDAAAGTYDAGSHTTALALTSGGATVASLTLDGDYAGDAFGVSLPVGGFVTIGLQINAAADFNGDGSGDVLIQNDQNGQLIFAAMQHGALAGWDDATGGLANWTVGGHGDIDGDGFSDAVVTDPSSGQVWIAEQHGSGTPTWVLGPQIPGFTVVGVGDIQGDDRADLVMQNASGRIDYYDTKNNNLVSVKNTPGWNVAGVGDVNGDGYADIVIQNQSTGQIAYADMHGGGFSGWGTVATTPGYTVQAVADLTGDGFADIVVQNTTSPANVFSNALYADMRGGLFSGWGVATTGLTPDWVISDTADVFNTGHADLIVQQHSTGTTVYAAEGASGFQQWGYVTPGLNSHFHVV